MNVFAPYSHAIVSMALMALILLGMSPLVGMRKSAAGLAPGAAPEPDYSNALYRWHRAQGNLSESLTAFVAVTVAAMLAGASPFWVNLLASLFVVSRVVMAVVHVKGIGKADHSLRSYAYVVGFACCMVLGLIAIFAAFGGQG